jgi:addiction module HigA family antidote
MVERSQEPLHPGAFIREHVIPPGMSVKDAAKRLRIGRPALSNLLNGNSSLSPEMAVRLEKAFGANRQQILDLQARFDRHGQREDEKVLAVRAYVPGFLTIKARQIHDWVQGNLEARNLFPILLRKLVRSTGHELRQVDFPGYDNAERKGWDGVVEAGAATPWISEGRSCWEFGVNQDPGAKAEKDYAARLSSVPPIERAECTFVFVTPRNWSGKAEWARNKNIAGDWKTVRALDASDLEQWLEESIPAQIWLAEKLGMPVSGFETLDRCWQRWAAASDPRIVPAIFEPSISAYRATFKAWLEKHSERPFIIAADSKDEALAFLACMFQESDFTRSKDLAAVFESAQTLRTLASSSSPFIPIVCTEEAERELATVYRRLHCIIVRPRNAVDSDPDIALDLLGHDAFEKALAAMGIEGDDAERLARESGRSPTILRRRLSKIDAIRTPEWAKDAEVAKSLIPMTLVGAWHAKSNADCEVVSVLADRPYQMIEESVARLLQFDDCPVWAAGQYRGVASKIDALFAISKSVTEKDLTEFFMLAEYVLSESDPAINLPEDRRWAAGLYGKVRDHSAALREGICETLVILSVHGNNLFRDRLGIDVKARVSLLVRQLLTPLTLEKLLSHDNDLPRYAEAAPDEILKLLESDLRQPQPVVLGLLKPADSGVFGGCPRTELLWALECLAWKHLGRVSAILAQLSRTVIEDNWVNKPIASLEAIYRSWMPQTAASLEERAKALETLTKRFRDIGWQICIEQFEPDSQIGHHSYRPRWSGDASGAGQPVTRKEIYEFARKALDLALAWPKHDQKTLGDLVERLQGMPEEDQAAVWDLIDVWAAAETDDKAKADLRERIRQFAFTRWGRRRGLKDATKNRARAAYAKLQARDPVVRHAWLFANQWVEESADEIDDEKLDFTKREERIHKLRAATMKEIWAERGFEGVTALLAGSEAPHIVGRYLGLVITGAKAPADFLRRCLSLTGDLRRKVDGCIQGFLLSVDDKARGAILSAVAKGGDADQIARLFRCAPFGQHTWRLLDQYGEETRDRYWQGVFPHWNRHSEAELIELIDRLLEAKRPRAAFHAVHMDWPEIETSRLKRLLLAVATVDAEPAGHYKLNAHYISEALNSLDGRTGVNPDEMAHLEFLFIEALNHSEHGIPNLERQIAESPAIFVQALALTYKRRDDRQDPPEWRIDDPERRAGIASAAYRLLDQIKRIPGTGPDGKVNTEALLAWVTEVRRLCAENGRAEIGDHQIGQLLSRAPAEEDGVWPCIPICEVMERIASPRIATGFDVGVYNARGVHSRGEGGAQERELVAKYRAWAKQRAFDYPYVGGVLESIAASYDREAEWHDSDAKVRKRLR